MIAAKVNNNVVVIILLLLLLLIIVIIIIAAVVVVIIIVIVITIIIIIIIIIIKKQQRISSIRHLLHGAMGTIFIWREKGEEYLESVRLRTEFIIVNQSHDIVVHDCAVPSVV